MATEIDTSRRCCRSILTDRLMSEDTSVTSGPVQKPGKDFTASGINRKNLKNILLNGSLIAVCLIGITVICVGAAGLAAIDGLATINRPAVFSKVPLAIIMLVSAVCGAGTVYLMVQALLAIGDDIDLGNHR